MAITYSKLGYNLSVHLTNIIVSDSIFVLLCTQRVEDKQRVNLIIVLADD